LGFRFRGNGSLSVRGNLSCITRPGDVLEFMGINLLQYCRCLFTRKTVALSCYFFDFHSYAMILLFSDCLRISLERGDFDFQRVER
jgi:hypothetical protein